ncbi:hypothetical protein MPTK2_4g19850 [Marchantia polymorpha subsp. ruderalis]
MLLLHPTHESLSRVSSYVQVELCIGHSGPHQGIVNVEECFGSCGSVSQKGPVEPPHMVHKTHFPVEIPAPARVLPRMMLSPTLLLIFRIN